MKDWDWTGRFCVWTSRANRRAMTSISSDYRPDIDGLRAVAILSVLLFHADVAWIPGGFLGVDVFFVISGFLITGLIRKDVAAGSLSFSAFYTRRARRLFPALLGTVVLTFLAATLIYPPDLLIETASSSIAALFSLSNVYFWLDSGYFDSESVLKPLLHTWSLSVEEQFYLVWPAILVLTLRRSAITAAIVLGAASIAAVVAGLLILPDHSGAVFYLTPFRVFEFALGAGVTFLRSRPITRGLSEATCGIGLLLIAISVFVFDEATPFALNGLLPSVGAGLVIFGGAGSAIGGLLRNRVPVWIGRVSYSTYLVHWPIVVFFRFLIDRPFSPLEQAGLVAAALAAGAVMFSLVEERFRERRGDGITRPRPRTFWLRYAAVAAIAIVPAVSTQLDGGWPWRLGDRAAIYRAASTTDEGKYGGFGCAPHECRTGTGEARPIYVIGDSHARAYYAGLRALYPARPLVFFTANACLIFSERLSADWLESNPMGDECAATRGAAFEALRALPDNSFDLVIAGSWAATDLIDKQSGEVIRFTPDDDTAFAAAVSGEVRRLIADLAPHAVTVVGNVPTTGQFGKSPLQCISRPMLAAEQDCSSYPIIDGSIISKRRDTNDALRMALDGIAIFADPMPALCDGSQCATIRNGKPVYSDWDHLSGWGSMLVVRAAFPDLT